MKTTNLVIEDCRLLGGESVALVEEAGKVTTVPIGGTPRGFHATSARKVIDCGGGTLLPGLVDTHCHPFMLGRLKRSVDLSGTQDTDGIRRRLKEKIADVQPGDWIIGMGWNQETFPAKRYPTRDDIDSVSPRNPALLTRICGHIVLLTAWR